MEAGWLVSAESYMNICAQKNKLFIYHPASSHLILVPPSSPFRSKENMRVTRLWRKMNLHFSISSAQMGGMRCKFFLILMLPLQKKCMYVRHTLISFGIITLFPFSLTSALASNVINGEMDLNE